MSKPASSPTIALFGIPFDDLTMAEAIEAIDRIVERREPRFIVTPNLDFAAQARDDADLHRILLDAERVFCDGMPLVWVSRLLGAPLRERVAGSDMLPLIAQNAARKGHRLYFLGSTPGVPEKAREVLAARYPGLQVVGIDSPPFAPLDQMDHEAIGERIRRARPDILLVAFGCPKQEKWIAMNHRALGVPCSIGVGASIDFIAGRVTRAPAWMRRTGSEWIFRLLQEPRRLFRRYAWDFCFLFLDLAGHLAGIGRTAKSYLTLTERTSDCGPDRLLDLSGAPCLGLHDLGAIARLEREARRGGGRLLVLGASPAARRALRASRFDRLIRLLRKDPRRSDTAGKIRVALSCGMIQGGKSGVAQYVFGLLDGLAPFRDRLDLTLAGFRSDRPLFERWLSWCRWLDIPEAASGAVANLLWHQTSFRRWLKRERIEVVHIPSYRRIIRKPPCAQLVTIHDCAAFNLRGKYDRARTFFGKRVVPRLAAGADRIVAVSETTARDVARHFRLPRERIGVVLNGIDHRRYRPPSGEELRRWRESGAAPAGPYFIYIARLEHPGKNHVRLIEAFEIFKQRTGLPHELVLGGADWHGAAIVHQRIAASPAAGSIRRLGFVAPADLPFWYAGAAALVFPSLFEGFGFPPLEAMACGCPVVSSASGSLEEVTGAACLRIDPENAFEIAQAMERIAGDGPLAQDLRRQGLIQAEKYSWQRVGREIFTLYNELACASPARETV